MVTVVDGSSVVVVDAVVVELVVGIDPTTEVVLVESPLAVHDTRSTTATAKDRLNSRMNTP